MEKMKKSVKIGKVIYEVEMEGDKIKTHKREYIKTGYDNCYGTKCVCDLGHEDWAKITVWGYNHMAQWMARGIAQIMKQKFDKAKDGTYEVKELHDYICSLLYVSEKVS